jgi:hypothetical protein
VADPRTLSRRALNRATLDRQFLLRRHPLAPLAAVRHLVGLQAQAPQAPYLGLWTRLSGFSPEDFSNLLAERAVARAPVMRATVHVVDATDFAVFRPLFQTLMERGLKSNYGRRLAGVDLPELAKRAHGHLAERPLTRAELGKLLAARWPENDPLALAYAVTYLVPTLQVPPRGLWKRTGQPTWSAADAWLAPPPTSPPPQLADPVKALVLRYLAAFGPASVNDVQTWSGLTRLREITERLDLRHYRTEDGADLLDVPDVPLPDPDTPAPPRFLPEYDNLLLSHADRRRVNPNGHQVPLAPGNGCNEGTLLIDGEWNALWKLARDGDVATIGVTPFVPLSPSARDDLATEALRLLDFLAPGHTQDVRIAAP